MKNILIIGGTGTLGKELIRQLYKKSNIVCLSRCELKQKELSFYFPKVKYILGDIRDSNSLERAFDISPKFDCVFLVAALKHIDILEKNIEESVKTNILGTINVINACKKFGSSMLVFSSTDKAVDPINCYGYSKALSEKLVLQNNDQEKLKTYVFRWGNILGSRGSVVPYFVECLKAGKPIPVTDPRMTRFWLKIEDAVTFVLTTIKKEKPGLYLPPVKAASVIKVISTLAKMMKIKKYRTVYVGKRNGEKLHERLRSEHDSVGVIQSNYANLSLNDPELKKLLLEFVK